MQYRPHPISKTLILVLPLSSQKIFSSLDQLHLPHYVLPVGSDKLLNKWLDMRCKAGVATVCQEKDRKRYREQQEELLLLLLGVKNISEPTIFDLRGIQL